MFSTELFKTLDIPITLMKRISQFMLKLTGAVYSLNKQIKTNAMIFIQDAIYTIIIELNYCKIFF